MEGESTHLINLDAYTDEEIMNLDPEDLPLPGQEQEEEAQPADSQSVDSETDPDTLDDAGGTAEDDGSAEEEAEGTDQAPEDEYVEEDTSEAGTAEESDTAEDDQSEDETVEEESDDPEEDSDAIDYEAGYKELLAPFRAAKREIDLQGNIEDARRLMKMGVDYSDKMRAMKPNMRIVRTLEAAELLDPKKIDFMIDLVNKKPEAIAKLLKDSDIDPMTLDPESGKDYSPTDHGLSDAEFEVRDVIDNIKDSPKFEETVDIITNKMDKRSRTTLQAKPEVIAELHSHVEIGVYDRVMDRVDNLRMLGKLPSGLSTIEAYYQVGDAMHAAREFNDLLPEAPAPTVKSDTARQDSGSGAKKPKKKGDKAKLRNRKRAASPTKGKAAKGKKVPDFSKMTDEQIRKFDPASLN
jgi:hypothetical protein